MTTLQCSLCRHINIPITPGQAQRAISAMVRGTGFTLNLPLSAGATDADYDLTYARLALPVLRQFSPELVLISAGFDAHMDDPLAGMRLTSGYFGRLTRAIADVADATAQGRVVAVTEGGYDLAGLATSLRASIGSLAGDDADDDRPEGQTPRGEATIRAVTPHLAKYWKL